MICKAKPPEPECGGDYGPPCYWPTPEPSSWSVTIGPVPPEFVCPVCEEAQRQMAIVYQGLREWEKVTGISIASVTVTAQ